MRQIKEWSAWCYGTRGRHIFKGKDYGFVEKMGFMRWNILTFQTGTAQDRKSPPNRASVTSAKWDVSTELEGYYKMTPSNCHSPFTLLPSDKRYRSIRCRTIGLWSSFLSQAVRHSSFNSHTTAIWIWSVKHKGSTAEKLKCLLGGGGDLEWQTWNIYYWFVNHTFVMNPCWASSRDFLNCRRSFHCLICSLFVAFSPLTTGSCLEMKSCVNETFFLQISKRGRLLSLSHNPCKRPQWRIRAAVEKNCFYSQNSDFFFLWEVKETRHPPPPKKKNVSGPKPFP